MASSDNLASMELLGFMRPGFGDFWFNDFLSRENETLTRALQQSFDPSSASPEPIPTPTVSGISGSDPESSAGAGATTTAKRSRAVAGLGVVGGKATKRKSRATKRSQTTFITADAANFRQMVQQVTGARLTGAAAQFSAPIVRPEPMRGFSAGAGRFSGVGACPPTLDTSAALLLEQSQASPAMMSMTCPTPAMMSSFVSDVSNGYDFDAFPSFPTLESWKVM